MKKIKYIMMIAGFAAMGCGQPTTDCFNRIEIDNELREMKAFLKYDAEAGLIDSSYALMYHEQINTIIELNGYPVELDYYHNACENCDEID
tara:strand:- start:126 stop:398 length:273 start_codon:yes stop_codon:yes gene_type:complete